MKIKQIEDLLGVKFKWHQKVMLKMIGMPFFVCPVRYYGSLSSYKMLLWLCTVILNKNRFCGVDIGE